MFELKINLQFSSLNFDNKIDRLLSQKITYNNSDDKFKLKQYENKLEDILINKIVEDLINYLSSLE